MCTIGCMVIMVLKILSDALMGVIEMLEIAICDDNMEELNHVARMVQDIFAAKKIKHELRLFTIPNELLKYKGRFDIVILDIVMGEYNGIDVGRKLKEKDPDISLIYTTSYEQYVMQAINDAHAYSYLCKPINKEKMRQQLGAVLTRLPDRMAEKEFHKVIDSNNKEHLIVVNMIIAIFLAVNKYLFVAYWMCNGLIFTGALLVLGVVKQARNSNRKKERFE